MIYERFSSVKYLVPLFPFFFPNQNQTDEVFTVSDQEQIATDCLVKLCYQGDRDKDFVSPPNDMDLDVHVQERTAHSAEIGERLSPLVNSAKASDDSKLLIAQHKRILQNCTAHRKALKSSKQRYESDDDNLPLAIAWAQELSNMDRQQQILAKKAICNIIFEGQMGLLHQN